MGAGISLGEEQISAIVKRDLTEQHEAKMRNLPPCVPQYETWRKFIEDGHHAGVLRYVDESEKRVKAYKHPFP
jgi:hypothetical protein